MGIESEEFDRVFPELFASAFRAARRILLTEAEAEDAAAEALAKTLMHWRKVAGLAHRDAWVVRVAINCALDMARKRRGPPAQPDPIPDPADAAALRFALVAALSELPRRQREVIALRYLGDLSSVEVADALGISNNSVKKHAARAMHSLRNTVGPGLGEDSFALD